MKKLYFSLFLVVLSVFLAVAGDKIKVLRLYNGGVGTTIPLTNIDSINHSKYDADSVLNADYITSVTWAIDSIYQIPINSIDSAVVSEIDLDDYLAHIESIRTFIDAHGELEVNQFQKDLMVWLDEQDWVYMTTINDNKDLINITFTNGIDFYVDFQDASFYDEIEESNNTRVGLDLFDQFYDVSFQKDEEIIEKNQMLYIQGRTMPFSNAVSEENGLISSIDSSPIDCKLQTVSRNLNFILSDAIWWNYGIILISQTHGSIIGGFQVEDQTLKMELPNVVSLVVEEDGHLKMTGKNGFLYRVHPQILKRKIQDPDAIVFGNYCWSYNIVNYLGVNTVFGNKTISSYGTNKNYLINFISNMCNGFTYEDAIQPLKEYWRYMYEQWYIPNWDKVIPATNKPKSKQRYFSITTEDIIKNDVGFLVLKGKINGYDNLKKDELKNSFFVYCHEGGEEFTPESDNIEKFDLEIKEDGTFEKLLYADATYGYIAGFEYKEKVYYGEIKTYIMDSGVPCPDNNHPHMVDLGLPSGTKWACCNLGASKPEDYGNYYAWGTTVPIEELDEDYDEDEDEFPPLGNDGDISGTEYDVAFKTLGSPWRMPDWDMSQELLNECSKNWTTINGINGLLLTGPNGNYIFMPANGTWDDGTIKGLGLSGNYWTSELEDYFTTAHSLFFKGSESSLTSYVSWSSYWYGHGVRAVSK